MGGSAEVLQEWGEISTEASGSRAAASFYCVIMFF